MTDETTTPTMTRDQLDFLKERVEAGSEPVQLARWLTRVTATGRLTVEVIAAAAEDLKNGDGAKWYAAADAAAARSR